MSIINKITGDIKLVSFLKVFITIISLPIITYLIKLYIGFLYNLGTYIGIFLRNLYEIVC